MGSNSTPEVNKSKLNACLAALRLSSNYQKESYYHTNVPSYLICERERERERDYSYLFFYSISDDLEKEGVGYMHSTMHN